MRHTVRQDLLTAQHINVALVYKDMLSLADAMEYLQREQISKEMADRVLLTDHRRKAQPPAPSGASTGVWAAGCRRRNHVHHAIVEAALKIEKRQGIDLARTLLKQENVPDRVAARIFAEGPRQVRARNGCG